MELLMDGGGAARQADWKSTKEQWTIFWIKNEVCVLNDLLVGRTTGIVEWKFKYHANPSQLPLMTLASATEVMLLLLACDRKQVEII